MYIVHYKNELRINGVISEGKQDKTYNNTYNNTYAIVYLALLLLDRHHMLLSFTNSVMNKKNRVIEVLMSILP